MTIANVECYIAAISRAASPIITPISKLGGNPVFVAQPETPSCRNCGQRMDFIGQFRLDSPLCLSHRFQIAYVFMCPGQYDERGWLLCPAFEAFSGANAVLLQEEESNLPLLPDKLARYPEYALTFRCVPEPNIDVGRFDLADNQWEQVSEAMKIGGDPAWLQNNETPHCPHCGKFMRFVAQIDAELDGPLPADQTQWERYHFFDFGAAGLGYTFICPDDCSPYGAFLWQST